MEDQKEKVKEKLQHHEPVEITVATVGSVDSGKSTTVGVLTDPIHALDNGKGLARSRLFNFPHEHISGNTSSVGHAYIKEHNNILNFVDLAGHEKYLKTTIYGVTTYFPDFGLVCVAEKLTNMTREHIRILYTLHIPFMFLITKIDSIPAHVIENNVDTLTKLATKFKSTVLEIKTMEDINTYFSQTTHQQQQTQQSTGTSKSLNAPITPMLRISNTTGLNHDLLRAMLHRVQKRKQHLYPGFVVDHVFKVQGHGTVVSGVNNVPVTPGMDMYIGPFGESGEFEAVRVRSLHNDYREEVKELRTGVRGCLCIVFKNKKAAELDLHGKLRSGMIVAPQPLPVHRRFKAEVMIFHHSTSIAPGYVAFMNCGSVKGPVKFIEVDGILRSGDRATVLLEMTIPNYIEPKYPFFFREGDTRGIGKIVECL